MGTRLKVTLGVVMVGAGMAFLTPRLAAAQPNPGTATVFTHGTVVAALGPVGARKTKDVELPAAKVFLVPLGDRAHPVASTLTDLSGRFMLKTTKRGVFSICVEAEGFTFGLNGCSDKEFRIEAANLNLGTLRVTPISNDASAALFGTLRLRDGRLPRGFYPFLGVNAHATAELTTAGGTTYSGFVNNFGEYVIPQVPVREAFGVQFKIDNEVLTRDVDPKTGLSPGRAYELSAVFANAAPRVHGLHATSNGKPVQVIAPGSQVRLHAVADDPDGDALEYRWILPDSAASVAPTATPDLVWTVPTLKRRFAVTVVVSDRRGGYSQSSVMVDASTLRAIFSGTVLDPAGAPIEGAQVDVNGRLVATDSRGWFAFNIPVADRYVMNIRKTGLGSPNAIGFGTASFIYQGSVAAGRWTLRRAQISTVDPRTAISLQQKRGRLDCPSPLSSRLDWPAYLQPGVFDWQNGRGDSQALNDLGQKDPRSTQNVMRLLSRINPALAGSFSQATGVRQSGDDRPPSCGPGIKIDIPPNSLAEAGTNRPPSGNLQIALSSVSLTSGDQMPGDYTVSDNSGNLSAVESFGAGSVEIGTATQRYNLRPGAKAAVSIPVDVTQLAGGAALSPTIPLLYYDERQGLWRPEGQAKLTGSGATLAYTATVTHFSTINSDIFKSTPSCVAVEVDSSLSSLLPFTAEVVMQPSVVNPGVIQVRQLQVDSLNANAIYNLPNNSDIVLTPVVSGVQPDGSSGNVPAGVFVVNTGGPQTGGAGKPKANADGSYYSESGGVATGPCASRVTLRRLNPPALTAPDEFLQGLSFEASNLRELGLSDPGIVTKIEKGVDDYYQQADPRNLRASFNLFKTKNRFGQPLGATEVEQDAQYANSGDLGFGRDMHCRRNVGTDGASDYACYVTNFGQPPKFLPDQQDANDTSDATKADATVAMEFSRIENAPGDPNEFQDNDRAVKFYVYNTSQPDSTVRIKKADLDGHGERPVPQLCMVCHGGNLTSTAADPSNPGGTKIGAFADRQDILDMHSNFLPFDLHLFNYPMTKSKAAQQAAFKVLNTEIVKGVSVSTTTGAAIGEVIDTSFYPGGSVIQLEDQVIAGWDPGTPTSNTHKLYQNVLASACRTCHIAQPFGAPTFSTSADFANRIASVQDKVCTRKIMPHAQRTNDIFWQSLNPNMPAFLELYGQSLPGWASTGAAQCALFFQPGTTATSTFQSKILPILQINCGSCHGTAGNANFGVNQAPAAVYNELLHTAAKDGTSYVVPGNSGTSKLFQRVSGSAQGTRMPQNGPPYLDAIDTDGDGTNDQQELLNWITAQAVGP